uniref:Uncharacterized protein n=1 Tax=Haptolina brevifila TaxID=156173 RepID=A0A7S2JJN9_9EUKA
MAAASPDRSVHLVANELSGTELAMTLAGCAFDLIPVDDLSALEIGNIYRAQAAGSIPLSTRHLRSVLPLACGRWDLGPPPTNATLSSDADLRRRYLASVVAVGSRKLKKHREAMVEWAAAIHASQDASVVWHTAFAPHWPLSAFPSPLASPSPSPSLLP